LILGTPALTTRGMKESDMDKVAEFIDRGVQIAKTIQTKAGKLMVEISLILLVWLIFEIFILMSFRYHILSIFESKEETNVINFGR